MFVSLRRPTNDPSDGTEGPTHNQGVVDRISSAQRVKNVVYQLPPKLSLDKNCPPDGVAILL
jgi:hypothetical protein